MVNGKVITGFSHPRVAKYSHSAGVVTYSQGRAFARGVEIDISPDTSDDNIFYADNQAAESAAGTFTKAKVTVTADSPFIEAEKMVMGIPDQTGDWTDYDTTQQVPYVGFGFIVRYMSDSVTTYVPMVLKKIKFDQFKIGAKTQGEDIDWQTSEFPATVLRDDTPKGTWKSIGKDYSAEEEALASLDAFLNITASNNNTTPGGEDTGEG